MKVIDLLNKIANGEKVPNFIVDEVEYYMGTNGYLRECMGDDAVWFIDKSWLNTEAQTLEEPKGIPEKLTPFEAPFLKGEEPDIRFRLIIDQINKIIDYLESKGDE